MLFSHVISFITIFIRLVTMLSSGNKHVFKGKEKVFKVSWVVKSHFEEKNKEKHLGVILYVN